MSEQTVDVLIVGAGISGLACARDLQAAGKSVLVLDKGRSVGGRCSTWRTESGHIVDYGVTFFHGSDREFLAELDQFDDRIEGWPRRIEGRGDPCQPRAFAAHERRVGLSDGVSGLPKHLARGLTVRTATRVERIVETDGRIAVELEEGELANAGNVVLALPCEQVRDLLATVAETIGELAAVRRLLSMLGTVPCLTVMATYARPAPDWHLLLPEGSESIQMVTNESSKRPKTAGTALVLQARPAWSAANLKVPPETWAAALLEEAAGHVGEWVMRPTWSRAHRWRYARTDLATELAEPILIEREQLRLGITGELFARGAGVEAAYLAGRGLARRIVGGQHE